MYRRLFPFMMIWLLWACHHGPEQQIAYTLELAGDNRAQLEEVLTYYSRHKGDSLKLRAAEYLIANMPGHYSYVGARIEEYYREAEKIVFGELRNKNKQAEQLNTLHQRLSLDTFDKVEDCSVITADFLIDNIERAFADWQEGTWAKGLDFEEFCEYLLPYKCTEGQALDDWRQALYPIAIDTLRDFAYNDIWNRTAFQAAEAVNISMRKDVIVDLKKPLGTHALYKVPFWCHIPSNSCETRTTTAQAILRSKGFPVAYDFVLQWATSDNAHAWLNVRMDHKRGIPCEGGHEALLPDVRPGECKGKVYRRTYAPNPEWVQLVNESEHVPSTLHNVFMRDVTDEYVTTADVTLEVLPDKCREGERYAYLAVFGGGRWTPICFARITDKHRITFKGLEKGAVYLPVYYTANGIEPFHAPVLLNERGGIEVLLPDTTRHEVKLQRKYPLFRKAFTTALRLRGSMFQAANRPDFADAATLYTFDTYAVTGYVDVKDTTRYRYWRYICPAAYRCNIAELLFHDEQGKVLSGTIIGSEERSPNPNYSRAVAFDGNPFTFFASKPVENGWVGLDLGIPRRVSRIGYMTRSDDNNIRIGDTYELMYWDKDGWTSLGQQVADELVLTCQQVPVGALLWLKDLTRGSDERIFLYRDGKQLWF